MNVAGNIIAGIQGSMKKVGEFGGDGKIPAWLWATVHITLWTIGFIFLYSAYPFVRAYMSIDKKKKG